MLQVTQTNVTGTTAVNIIPASGDTSVLRHLKALVLSTLDAAAAVVTLSDGSKTVMVLNLPASAAAPLQPTVVTVPIPQSVGNKAWTLTVSVNASGMQTPAVWSEDPRDIT